MLTASALHVLRHGGYLRHGAEHASIQYPFGLSVLPPSVSSWLR